MRGREEEETGDEGEVRAGGGRGKENGEKGGRETGEIFPPQEGSRVTRGGRGGAGGGRGLTPSNTSYPDFIILLYRLIVYMAYSSSLSILHHHYCSADSHLFWLYLLMPLYHYIILCHFGGPAIGTCRFSVLWHRIMVCVAYPPLLTYAFHVIFSLYYASLRQSWHVWFIYPMAPSHGVRCISAILVPLKHKHIVQQDWFGGCVIDTCGLHYPLASPHSVSDISTIFVLSNTTPGWLLYIRLFTMIVALLEFVDDLL